MSWLRDHFYSFVYPAFQLSVRDSSASSDQVAAYGPHDVKLWPGEQLDPELPGELAKLKVLCQRHSIKWITSRQTMASCVRGGLHYDLLRRTLLSAEAQRRDHGCSRLLFAGRDVWPLEVLAQRRGLKSVFIPEMSRLVTHPPIYSTQSWSAYHSDSGSNAKTGAQHILWLLAKYGIDPDEPVLMVDTGYVGSIVRAMSRAVGHPVKFALMSQTPRGCISVPETELEPLNSFFDRKVNRGRGNKVLHANSTPNQLFPNRRKARKEVLDTEYLPKYFKTGTVKEGRVVQYLSSPEEIVGAAVLTSDLWRGVKQRKVRKETETYA